jgi:gliding motility-associated-like protein
MIQASKNNMKLFFSLLFILFGVQAKATHIVGGEMWYDYISPGTYKIYIALFRDCASTGAQYDNPLSLGIFNSANSLLREVTVTFPGSSPVPVNFSNPCISPPAGICVEKTIYTTTVTNLTPIVGGYTLAYTRCCRGPNVQNLINPDNVGITITAHIPGSETGFSINSSPRFTGYPPLVLCAGQDFSFDHSATDPNGDVLVYDLVAPYVGGTSSVPMPQPPPNPPYSLAPWDAGYSAAMPLGAGANVVINPTTGFLTATPSTLGLFAVGIRVREYRAGVLVGETRRDFLWKVVSCIVNLDAVITPQIDLGSQYGPCTGLDIQFQNESINGNNFQWDFGVAGITTDVSSLVAPSYLYPGNGTYTVTLIVNPGWPCSDTAVEVFTLSQEVNVLMKSLDSVCIDGNSIDFEAYGYSEPTTVLTWDFGPHATPSTGVGQFVNNVVFDTSGFIPVSVNAVFGICDSDALDSVLIYDHPKNNFNIPPGLQCAPFTVLFLDSTQSIAPLSYYWEFGDGGTSTLPTPTHTYLLSGNYDVALTIETSIGCIDSIRLLKPNLVKVKPSPTSDFIVSPAITDIYHTWISFTDISIDSDYMKYIFNDSTETLDRNTSFSYFEGGYHYPMQVVMNEFGCRDTSIQTIYVKPETTIYVPNTFTPDGDDYNNVFLPIVLDAKEYEFIIFDRWGTAFFKTNDTKEGWNGCNGKMNAPDGTYVYRIRYVDYQTELRKEIVGHFNLLR